MIKLTLWRARRNAGIRHKRCGCKLLYNQKYRRWQYLKCCEKRLIRMLHGQKA